MTRSPVVLLVFNRPRLTAELMEIVRAQRPSTLIVVADGPRADVPSDVSRCDEVRRIAVDVDWPCNVITDFSGVNLGCGPRIATGIDAAFGIVDRAIVLEDDIRPDPTFFRFCDDMLDRYADDPRVFQVSGHNPLGRWDSGGSSYVFSRSVGVWGWATWRRAWSAYDISLERYRSETSEQAIRHGALDDAHAHYLQWLLSLDVAKVADTWDVSWTMTVRALRGLVVVPTSNLITNVGFGRDATHLVDDSDIASAVRSFATGFPLVAPLETAVDEGYEASAVMIERLRVLRDIPKVAFVARSMERNPGLQRINPALRNAIAGLRDPLVARQALETLRPHCHPWPPLDEAIDALAELAAFPEPPVR
jgi:hypothetical protein